MVRFRHLGPFLRLLRLAANMVAPRPKSPRCADRDGIGIPPKTVPIGNSHRAAGYSSEAARSRIGGSIVGLVTSGAVIPLCLRTTPILQNQPATLQLRILRVFELCLGLKTSSCGRRFLPLFRSVAFSPVDPSRCSEIDFGRLLAPCR